MDILYDLKDVSIIPSAISEIDSRKECNPYQENGKLPVFNAPMSVLMQSGKDVAKMYAHPLNIVIPRSFTLEERLEFMMQFPEAFIAIGLNEADSVLNFISAKKNEGTRIFAKILIDIANGHMKRLTDTCRSMKEKHPDMTIMAGNIANPDTLPEYEKAGIDYVRCSVGSGSGCITTPSTGVYYPLASLIKRCREIKNERNLKIKIIADGGIDTFSKICKSLALGADYVMCGKIFAQCEDINLDLVSTDGEGRKTREYFGMASKKGQEAMNLSKIKTEEGRCITIDVKYTLEELLTMINDYLRSSMSYCNCRTLGEFTGGKVRLALISSNASVIFDRN